MQGGGNGRAATPSFVSANELCNLTAGTRLVIGCRSRDVFCLPRSRLPASLTADLPHMGECRGERVASLAACSRCSEEGR